MDLLGSLSQDAQPEYAKCSRKSCQQAAEFQLLWNNPKVHTPERRKIWLACSEHVGWLGELPARARILEADSAL